MAEKEKPKGSLDELWDLYKQFDTAMLVTLTPEHLLRARPMEIQDPDEVDECDLWFVTSDASAMVSEIERDEQVGVCCLRSRDKAWLSISASARVVRDRRHIRDLWRSRWNSWLPGGPDDPGTCLLELQVERAEYWDPEGGRMRVLFEAARSIVTGEPASRHLEPPKQI